jgi:hypothetical protein
MNQNISLPSTFGMELELEEDKRISSQYLTKDMTQSNNNWRPRRNKQT